MRKKVLDEYKTTFGYQNILMRLKFFGELEYQDKYLLLFDFYLARKKFFPREGIFPPEKIFLH